MTLTLGKQFNAEHCLIIENVPVIMAWLPTTAANTANTRTGHLNFSGKQKRENCQLAETRNPPSPTSYQKMNELCNTYLEQIHKIRSDTHAQLHDVWIDKQLVPYMQELKMDKPQK
jgi:hypothetical protein